MRFTPTPVDGAVVIDLEPHTDERGLFARTFCTETFAAEGLEGGFVQANTSFSHAKGTLRGLHYQLAPSAEAKLVRCVRGALWDVVLDLRPASPSVGRWYGTELTADNRRALYVPQGCAHGFLTLTDGVEALYQVTAAYDPARERGVRWDDPRFAIAWPASPMLMSERDRSHPDFDPADTVSEAG
jgi:dTDP-4-dehydrorhamnose 3,5-epimerase